MALSIGAVNFGVEAQTAGLKKAIDQMLRFQKVVDQTANSQAKGADKAAAALGKQESAMKRALQQSLNLRRALLQASAPPEQLAAVSTAFKRLSTELTSGRLTTVEFTRAMDAFNTKMGRVRRTLSDLKAKQAARDVTTLQDVMRNLESASVLAIGPLSGLGARIRSLGAIIGRTKVQMVIFIGTMTALTVGFAKLVAGAIRAEILFEKIEARFMSMSASQGIATRQMAFVIQTADQLGLRIEDLAGSYSRLVAATAGTNLEGEATREIFLGIAKAAAALRLETTEVEGIFRAVEQMISKGQVAAEELRGQLGERLPGAFRLFAESMGLVDDVTGSATQKLNALLREGQVGTDQILEFARHLDNTFGDAAVRNVDSFQGALNRLSNEVLLFNKQFNETFRVGDLVAVLINKLADIIQFLTGHIRTAGIVAGALTGAMIGLTAPSVILGVVKLAQAIRGAAISLAAMAGASAAAARGMGALIQIGTILGGAAAGAIAMQKALADVDATLRDIDSSLQGGGGGSIQVLSESALEALNNIKRMRSESNELIRTLDTVTPFTDAFGLEGLLEARKILRDISTQDLPLFTEQLRQLNPEAFADLGAEEILANIVATTADFEQQWSDMLSSIRATPEIVANANEELDYMRRLLVALNQGPRAMELFDAEQRRADALHRFIQDLDKANISAQDRNRYIEEYIQLLDQVGQAEDRFNTFSEDLARTLTRGLEEAIFSGQKLKDVMRELGKEILRVAMRALVFAPLERGLSSFFGGLFGGPSVGVPARALGGPSKGLTLVGEQGPELVNLGSTSMITPLNKAGGVYQEIHLHFDVGLESVDARVAQAAPIVTKAARDAVLNAMYRPSMA